MSAAACGGATLAPAPQKDGGESKDAGTPIDARTQDAPGVGDGGCINPVVGEACTDTSAACPQPGDPCCIGYEWSCQSGAWAKLGLGCACRVEPDAGLDAGPDCGQPPEPTYSCAAADAAPRDGGVCGAYGVDGGAGGPTYPLGCVVTLSTCNSSFGGAQTCNCQPFPGNPQPTWVCPL
jgi:hypothetical protein